MGISENVSLQEYNSFGVEAAARYFSKINSLIALEGLFRDGNLKSSDIFVLGDGTNTLFTRDFDGLVLRVAIPGIEVLFEDQKIVKLKVGSGINWHDLVCKCVEQEWYGTENLALIPGTVGAAPVQNIGAYGVELKDFLEVVEVFDLSTLELREIEGKDCKFGYRRSIFKESGSRNLAVTAVTIRLRKEPLFQVGYPALREYLSETSGLTAKKIADAVCEIRRKRLPDPKIAGNCGSFFKNPIVSGKFYSELKGEYPDLPGFELDSEKIKLSAAWMIDRCGWRGRSLNNAGVDNGHPLVIVNLGGASGRDILDLSGRIRQSVQDTFNVELIPEVTIL